MSGDFMRGFRPDPPVPAPRWMPGQTYLVVQALCCPGCGSTDIHKRDNNKSDSVQRWECSACRAGFKLPSCEAKRCYSTG